MLDWLLAIYKFVFPFLVGGLGGLWVGGLGGWVGGLGWVLYCTAVLRCLWFGAGALTCPAPLHSQAVTAPTPAWLPCSCHCHCLPAHLPAHLPGCLQIISMVAKMSGGQEGGEAAKPQQTDRGAAAEERGLPPALERQLSRRASQQQQHVALYSGTNGLGDPFAQQQQQRRQPLAINGSVARAAKAGGGSSSSGGAADRGGSLSPRGPETPMEGSAGRLLPQHPAAAAGRRRAQPSCAVSMYAYMAGCA